MTHLYLNPLRICLRGLGLGLALIIPGESCKFCDGDAERLRLDELPGCEALRKVYVSSETALSPQGCDAEKVRPRGGVGARMHALAAVAERHRFEDSGRRESRMSSEETSGDVRFWPLASCVFTEEGGSDGICHSMSFA